MKIDEAINIAKERIKLDRQSRNYETKSDYDKFCEKHNIAIETILEMVCKSIGGIV